MENNKNPEIINDEQNKQLTNEELEKTSGGFDFLRLFRSIGDTNEQLKGKDLLSDYTHD